MAQSAITHAQFSYYLYCDILLEFPGGINLSPSCAPNSAEQLSS